MTPDRDQGTTDERRPLPAAPGWQPDEERRPAHSTLRLQPVMLGPPPDPDHVGASSDDDLDLRDLDRSRPRGGVAALAATRFILAVGVGGAF
ncbi:MAG: hypothetical protein ACRCTI_21590, partial [Beijerinckiaceae bacterium]